MLFDSFDFAIFLPVVFILYWLLNRNLKLQNALIIVASYFFYGYWDWRFCLLMAVSSLTDFIIGQSISQVKSSNAKRLVWLSVGINLTLLGFFKYYNFFVDSFMSTFTFLGYQFNSSLSLNIILPVGISFYTFQTISYSIDVYRGSVKPTKDVLAFFAFVSFFPQLVAGPIEKAKNLLPQFQNHRKFNDSEARNGLRQMLVGFIKKIVVADNLSEYSNYIFENYQSLPANILFLGCVCFAFQLYADFSGYSDIAIGAAKLFGINLSTNFRMPFFSQNIAELWRRWHISLGSFFKEYMYIPLRKKNNGLFPKPLALILTFLFIGLWHGAGWSFVVWGFINGVLVLPLFTPKASENEYSLKAWFLRLAVILVFSISGILVLGYDKAFYITYYSNLFSRSLFWMPHKYFLEIFMYIIPLLFIEWITRKKDHFLQIDNLKTSLRWGIYIICVLVVIRFGQFNHEEFFYFQF